MRFSLGDVTDSSGTGSTDTSGSLSTPSLLQQIVQGFTQYKLGQQQLNTANQITQLNLQRIQAGLPPIQLDSSAMGVPTMSVGLSSGTQQLLTYGLLGAGALWLFSSMSKRR